MITALVVVLLWKLSESRQVPVLVVKRNLPAYHLLSMDDVVLSTRPAEEEAHYAALPIDGRLTLKPIQRDEALATSDLSPKVTDFLGHAVVVTGISVPGAGALAGTLRSGDRIRLIFPGRSRKVLGLNGVVMSPVTKESNGRASLAVALRLKEAEAHASEILSDRVFLLRSAN
ncbi:SAF domain-containing protein [Planotetraspora mira]|nr:SAF domain-containing protein [Planotetraspora mira]